MRTLYAGIVIVLAAVAASTAVAVFSLSAQTGPTLEFTDDAGSPIDHVVLASVGDSVDIGLRVSDIQGLDVDVAQMSIVHNPAEVSITHTCGDLFTPAEIDWSGRNETDGSTYFICGIADPISADSGQIMTLTVTRLIDLDRILEFETNGTLPTKLFALNVPVEFLQPLGSLGIFAVEPDPTTVPESPTPTATAPSGGGGGGAPPQVPTPVLPGFQPPGAPRNVVVTPVVDGVQLRWQPPTDNGGAEVTSYRVLIVPGAQVVIVSSGQTTTTIKPLDPVESYQFQINAINFVGTGPSADITDPVSPLEPLSAPRFASASLLPDGVSVLVTWQAPRSTGTGPVTGYIIISNPAIGTGFEVRPDEFLVEFTGLDSSTIYSFSVIARTLEGLGPLSEPSNDVLTAQVTSSPTDPPVVDPSGSLIAANAQELQTFSQTISQAFGVQITLNVEGPSITAVDGGLLLEFPAIPFSGALAEPGPVTSKIGKLELDITNGSGTATLAIDDHVSIVGTARIWTRFDSVQVQIDDPTLLFTPPTPELFISGGGLVTVAGAEFDVEVLDLPGALGLTAEFVNDVEGIPGGVTSFQLAASGSGGEIENPNADIAFIVVVRKTDEMSADFGDNSVVLTVSRAWFEARVAEGKEIFITKIADDGSTYSIPASCLVAGDIARCTAVFTGSAGGFSIFSVVAVRPDIPAGSTPVTGEATQTPASGTPSATSTATTGVQPSATAESTVVPTPQSTPTATPLSAFQPTQQDPNIGEPTNGDPDASNGGSDGIPVWALLVIGLGAFAVLAPAIGGAFAIWKRQQIN